MHFEFFIALRYLIGRRKGLFTLITSGIAVSGVTLGVAALITTLAVMNGFHSEIQKRILGVQSHIILTTASGNSFPGYETVCNKVTQTKGVVACAPFVYGQAVLRKGKNSTGVLVKGIMPEREKKVSNIGEYISEGSLPEIKSGIILGKALARSLNAIKGDDVFLVSLTESQSLINLIPKIDKFTVVGTFDSGMYDYDSSVAYISFKAGQRVFGLGDRSTGIGIKVIKPDMSFKVVKGLASVLPGFWAQPWQLTNKNLFSALKLEKLMMFIILTLIVVVASFNIISNLLLFSIEKVKDIGILTALGATRKKIARIFFWEGTIIGISGITAGTILGIALSLFISKYQLVKLPAEVYYIDIIPVKLSAADIFSVIAAALLIVFISTIYPARKAAGTDPIEAIRYG